MHLNTNETLARMYLLAGWRSYFENKLKTDKCVNFISRYVCEGVERQCLAKCSVIRDE